ncbi:MAG: hypothetical protein OXC14_13240 [Rhodospirillaceae bacterium]|nr:hypothetical protein [Rhodospirillaceae bacterium]
MAENPCWPLAPRCDCGAKPGAEWPVCALACADGRGAADADAEDCPRWIDEAAACGWLAAVQDRI